MAAGTGIIKQAICEKCKHGDAFSYEAPGRADQAHVITRREVFCDNEETHKKYNGKCYWQPGDSCEFWEQ